MNYLITIFLQILQWHFSPSQFLMIIFKFAVFCEDFNLSDREFQRILLPNDRQLCPYVVVLTFGNWS